MAAKWAEALLTVQKADMRMRDIRARLDMLPAEHNRLVAKGRGAQARREAAKNALRETGLAIKSAESEILRLNETMTKLRQQSATIKKNTEYQAMLGEIAGLENKISAFENKILELMEKSEKQKQEILTVTAESEAVIKGVKTELTELDQFVLELRSEYKKLEAESKAAAEAIESGILERYRRLLNGTAGAPVVPVENGICGNCHLRLTPQTLNLTKSGQIATCDNCMHLIYLEE